MGIWKSFILIAVLVSLAPLANAGELSKLDSLSNKSDAIEYFKIGVNCFDDKDFKGALVSFQKAYELNPSWKLFYNIAHCEAALKMYGLAVITFERYLAEGGDAVPESRRDEVLAELERMRKMVGDIELVAPDGLDVYVDGIYRGVTPLPGPLSVSAGLLHQLTLKEKDETLLNVEKIVRGGTLSEVIYNPHETINEPQPVPPPTIATDVSLQQQSVATTSERKKLSPVPFIIVSGVTVLLGGTTLALAILVNNGKGNMSSESDASKLDTMRKVGLGTLFGTAGAGVAAVVLAAFTDFKGGGNSPVSFYGTSSEGGILIGGSF